MGVNTKFSGNFTKMIFDQPAEIRNTILKGSYIALQGEATKSVADVKSYMNAKKSGITYVVNKKPHIASASGEYLANASGALYRSLKGKVLTPLLARFTFLFYASIWENKGSGSKRLFMKNYLDKENNRIVNNIGNRIASILRFKYNIRVK